MENVLSLRGMTSVPEGVPANLVISIAGNGMSEREARAIMLDGGNAAEADDWIEKLRNAGIFSSGGPDLHTEVQATSAMASLAIVSEDAGSLLWSKILQALKTDENGFKHQVMVLDNSIKNTGGYGATKLGLLKNKKAGEVIPFFAIQDNCPWNGCKFAATSVMHFISGTTATAKQNACRSASRSLGGCTLPPKLAEKRWPYSLSKAYQKELSSVENHATALFVNVMDVEIMRNPSKEKGFWTVERPGTFAHVLVMTISKVGVYMYQAYGPRGYTLLQYMEKHQDDFPLTLSQGQAWVEEFEVFAADPCGRWTTEVNHAYNFCFDVDLVKLGCMSIGSQMDVYVKVEEHTFDSQTVEDNFAMLPQPDFSSYPECNDGAMARASKPPQKYIPDGGVPHYYVPLVTSCLNCGKKAPTGTKKHPQCGRCKKVYYCTKQCQVDDWKLRHKKDCPKLKASCQLSDK